MLIVNADDLGRDRQATDAALACYERGRITSTSAMVFMVDSERAAELARRTGIEVGLHLNLSEPFTAPDVPDKLRQNQQRICRFLKSSKYALLWYHPFLQKEFKSVFQAQYAEYTRLYGIEPTHIDGHQHMHLATNVLLGRLLPDGVNVRRSFSFRPGEKSLVNRWYRAAVDRWLKRRHVLTDYFFALSQNLRIEQLRRVVELARQAKVELMTHPQLASEYEFLMSDPYGQAIADIPLASYASC